MPRQITPGCLLMLFLLGGSTFAAEAWNQWRGPTGQGVSEAKGVPTTWNETENIEWKTELPGRGWSSPLIVDGKVWMTTAVDKLASPEETERRRKASSNPQPLRISESVSLRVLCVDLNTGHLLKNIEVLNQDQPQEIFHENSYASPTPVMENGRLYCHYGPYGIACFDTATDKVLWTNRSLVVKHENGCGSSPTLWKNLLIIHCDGIDQQYITALDKLTGDEVWKTSRTGELNPNPQLQKSYATSLVLDVDGREQVISPAADWVYGYEPDSGRELWKLKYDVLGFSNSARPVAADELLYICTGFMKAELLAMEVKGGGATIKWRHKKQVPNVACPVLVDGKLFFASDAGVASCLDAKSGDVLWTERIGNRFWASPIYANGHVYFFDTNGQTAVVKASSEFELVSKNKLDGRIYSSAAPMDGSLILRTDTAVYRMKN